MKRTLLILLIILLLGLLIGCNGQQENAQVVATTKPVYDFSTYLCQNTDIEVTLLVTENVSCLHDYTLQVRQMRAIEACQVVVMNGAGLEEFLSDALNGKETIIDASQGIDLLCGGHDHEHEHDGHHHENDPHIWLSIQNARHMAANISDGLIAQYPQHAETIQQNLAALNAEFDALDTYGKDAFSGLKCKELITFHDGFAYFAQYFGLHILHSLEEESGSEASASELKELVELVKAYKLPAIFVEENGSTSASGVISAETCVKIFTLNMAMGEQNYFESMYQNIDNIKEALG